jgi:hypothetical protein
MTTSDTEAIGTLVNASVDHGDITIRYELANNCKCGLCRETVILVKTIHYDEKLKRYVDLETELYRDEGSFAEIAEYLDKLTAEDIKTKIKKTEDNYDKH